MRLVLDTDIGSDVDDALALAFALRHPDIDLVAVTTVSGDPTLRARIAGRLVELDRGDRAAIEVAAGVGGFMDRNWGGHEGDGLDRLEEVAFSSRHGVDVLLDRVGPETALAVIGMQSNVAAAVDRDPSFATRAQTAVVMGGVFGPGFPPETDHNLVVDPAASIRGLNAVGTLLVPCDVTFRTALRPRHLEALEAGDGLCRALARMAEVWWRRWGDPEVVCRLHDPLAVACLTEQGRSLVQIERRSVTVAMHAAGHVRTFVDPLEGREVDVVVDADVDAFADYWLDVVMATPFSTH